MKVWYSDEFKLNFRFTDIDILVKWKYERVGKEMNLETTGLNSYTDQIIDISSAKLVDGEDGKFVYSKYKAKQNVFNWVSNQAK